MDSKKTILLVIILLPASMILSHFYLSEGLPREPNKTNAISNQGKILFARNNGYFSPLDAYSEMADFFTNEGYLVEEIQTEINDSVLEDVSILFVNTYQAGPNTFDETEKTAIESFVHSGGGLIMAMFSGGLDFGVKLTSYLGSIGSYSLVTNPSPITGSLPIPLINSSSSVYQITLSGTGRAVISTDGSSDIPNIPIIAANTYGQGRIIAVAAGTIWTDGSWSEGDNTNIMNNYLQWYEDDDIKSNFKVTFCRNNGYFSISNQYSLMGTFFEDNGYFVEEIPGEINTSVLASTSILFSNLYQLSSFNESEVSAIRSFVESGGGLIIVSATKGLEFTGIEIFSSMDTIDSHTLEMSPHPITANIPSPFINMSSSLFINTIVNGSAQTIISTDSSSDLPNKTVVAANFYGEGKILATTVASIWINDYWNNAGNSGLIANYLRWFENDGVKNFVFSKNNGYYSPNNAYQDLAYYVANLGYIVTDLADEEPTEELLNETDILFLNSYQLPSDSYSPESQNAIEDWVAKGGSLIIASDGISTLDFGFQIYDAGGLPNTLYTSSDFYKIYSHPVTINISGIAVTDRSPVSIFSLGETSTVVVSTTAKSHSPNRPIIVASNYDKGKVLGCGVNSIWDGNKNFSSNKDLIKNFIDWTLINTTTPYPSLSSPSDITYIEGSTGNIISWRAGSSYPYYYKIFLDGTSYQNGSWTSNDFIINVDGLSIGNHTFTIYVFDDYGRVATDSVNVLVNEAATTTTATATSTATSTATATATSTTDSPTTGTNDDPPSYLFLAYLLIAMFAVAMLFGLFIARGRRKH